METNLWVFFLSQDNAFVIGGLIPSQGRGFNVSYLHKWRDFVSFSVFCKEGLLTITIGLILGLHWVQLCRRLLPVMALSPWREQGKKIQQHAKGSQGAGWPS